MSLSISYLLFSAGVQCLITSSSVVILSTIMLFVYGYYNSPSSICYIIFNSK